MPFDKPHAVSPGLWALAWKRLRSDRVAMVSLAIVAVFLVMMLLSATGLLAKDWAREVGVNYAPPTFVGPAESTSAPAETAASDKPTELPIEDPLADALAAISNEGGAAPKAPEGAAAEDSKTVDPLADVMADIKSKAVAGVAAEARAQTLPLGGDKWGRDVLKKVLGTVFGAVAGYYGKWLDDFFNWFYSVFTAIPYLLLILAVAAVLQQKGTFTIVLILGLTGWTGTFRLIRGEYLKHKGREYVQAADAIGASNARRMFVHIFPNISHVVLVQLSIYTVAFIKSEVILSFLGFGVPVDVVSWGSMLNEAQNELILGKWWQLAAAGTFMAVLVTAFSLFTDALRDALDPKLK